MSNARLRYSLERTPTPMVAWMIDQGYVANDGGILEYTYIGRLGVNQSLTEANRATRKPVSDDLSPSVGASVDDLRHGSRSVGRSESISDDLSPSVGASVDDLRRSTSSEESISDDLRRSALPSGSISDDLRCDRRSDRRSGSISDDLSRSRPASEDDLRRSTSSEGSISDGLRRSSITRERL